MCPIDPESLKIGSPLTIEQDRACVNCGYNLIGLRSDGVCPECGRKIQIKKKDLPRYSDALVNAPKLWLAGLAMGSVLLFLGGVGMLVLLLVLAAVPGSMKLTISIFLIGAAVLWCVGAFITTQPRPIMPSTRVNPNTEWRGLRWTSRFTQVFWVGTAGLLALCWSKFRAGVFPPDVLFWGAAACAGIAALGLIWFCVYLSNVAFWGDDDLGANFRSTAWMIGAAAFLGLVHFVNVVTNAVLIGGFWASLVYALLLFFLVAPEFYLIYCLYELQKMSRWALTNHSIADAKNRRLLAQAKRNAKLGAAGGTSKTPAEGPIQLAEDSTVNPVDAAPMPAPLSATESSRRSRPEGSPRPYEVE